MTEEEFQSNGAAFVELLTRCGGTAPSLLTMNSVTLPAAEYQLLLRDAERYRWLRDARRTRPRPSWAPFVQDPSRSVLYAIAAYRGRALDAAVDSDRLWDKLNYFDFVNAVHGDAHFADPDYRFSDRYAGRLERAAARALRRVIDFANIRAFRRAGLLP